jgi:hypothetical protein
MAKITRLPDATLNFPTLPKDIHKSAYYWWWEYMKRVPNYDENHPLFKDFGVLTDDFMSWWHTDYWTGGGMRLFAEPPTLKMQIVQAERIPPFDPNDSFLLLVPLNENGRTVTKAKWKKMFNMLIGTLPKQHGRRLSKKAKYNLYTMPDVNALAITLDVYDMKQQNPEMTLWQIGNELHKQGKVMFRRKEVLKDTDSIYESRNKKQIMASTVSRYLLHARRYIDNVGVGIFPKK